MCGCPVISDPLTDAQIHTFTSRYADVNFVFFSSATKRTIINRIRRSASHAYVVGNPHVVNNGCRIVTHRSNNMLRIAQSRQ